MSMIAPSRRVAVLGLFAAMIFVASAAAVIARVSYVPVAAGEADARAAAADFLGMDARSDSSLVSVRFEEDPFGQGYDLYEVRTDTGGVIRVDKYGRIVGTFGVAVLPGDVKPPLTQTEAVDVVEKFLAEHHSDSAVLTLTRTEHTDELLTLLWEEFAPSGARLPREAIVTINRTTGEIVDYHARNEGALDVDTEPRIGEAEALKLYADSDRYRDTVLSEEIAPTLMTARDSRGVNRLVWCITFQQLVMTPTGETVPSTGSGAFFDAHTGEDITHEVLGMYVAN